MRNRIALIGMILMLGLASCNLPRPTPTSTVGPEDVQVYAQQTIQALGTQLALATPTSIILDTPVSEAVPTNTPVDSTATPQATPQPVATGTPVASPTPQTPTATPLPCDKAHFISDITIPDGTTMLPGATFVKTWELENVGSCTWTSSYAVVFANDGNSMGGPASKELTSGTVATGQKVQVSVELKAPTTPGTYRGYWILRNPSGLTFGTGPEDRPFYVDIKVAGSDYNFIDNYCKAEWRSGAGVLACPGSTGDAKGFVVRLDAPKLETGQTEDEAALWTSPQQVDNGEIRATFPAIDIANGARFRAIIGCLDGAPSCDVRFLLNYKVEGGSEATIAEWAEKSDNSWNKLNVDLSSLAGKKVQFILIVRANGTPNQDNAFWLQPRIGY